MAQRMNYLGAIVRPGYLICADPDDSEERMFRRFIHAASNGDETAFEILSSITILGHQATLIAEECGIKVSTRDNVVYLSPREYPRRFIGTCFDHLTKQAEDGNFMARLFTSWLMRKRLANPEFQIKERSQ
jgi:hypothetical protein